MVGYPGWQHCTTLTAGAFFWANSPDRVSIYPVDSTVYALAAFDQTTIRLLENYQSTHNWSTVLVPIMWPTSGWTIVD